MTEKPKPVDPAVEIEEEDEEMPSRMLELNEVLRIVPVSRTTLLLMEAEDRFPRGRFISPNRKVWRARDISKWQKNLPEGPVGRRPKPRRVAK